MAAKKPQNLVLDYKSGQPMPAWVRELIDVHLAIEAEDAKKAGALRFMARALVIATMPYKDPKKDAFVRANGNFRLRIVSGFEGGIPYGIYPRLLLSWVTSEAVRTESPVIELGDSLRVFLRNVLDLRSTGGGPRGTATRVAEQMKRLFGSLITAQYSGTDKRGFTLKNVLIADELEYEEGSLDLRDQPAGTSRDGALWTPQPKQEAGQWRSRVRLSNAFFNECMRAPVPIDIRAYKGLRDNPLAMDLYVWLTYRMKYLERRSHPIPWESLMMQFGSGYNTETDFGQAVRNFKKAFLRALKAVLVVYPEAALQIENNGLVLLPSPPHVAPAQGQGDLFLPGHV